MSELQTVEIWRKATGILDLPDDVERLAVPAVVEVSTEWSKQLERLRGSPALHEFSVRLHREWAIETGIIENLYDIERGVTQTLIERGFQAALMVPGSVNKDPRYIEALLNDQNHALEGLFAFVKQDRPLSVGYVRELHAAMTRSQHTTTALAPDGSAVELPMTHGEWKKTPNYPRRNGTQYLYCPPEHTASEMDRLVQLYGEHRAKRIPPEVEAAWLHHRFTQIHPFQDGNGRVARALATLVLIRDGLFPFIVPRDEKVQYLDALEIADSGDLGPLVFMIARRTEAVFASALGAMPT